MKVLVTGGAGFIGSHIVDKLIKRGFDVIIIDNLSTGKKENINLQARTYEVDITSPSALEEVFVLEKPNYVIHHGAQIDIQKSIIDPTYDANINILGTINILEKCREHSVDKLVYASSAAVYGNPKNLPVNEQHEINPLSFYGVSKFTPELYIKIFSNMYGIKYSILRYANVYGIRQDPKGEGGVVSIFIDKMLNNASPVVFGDGQQTRDFIYVSDVADANLAALSNGDNETFNISCNQRTSVNELISLMNSLTEQSLRPTYKENRDGDIKHSCLDNKKALNNLAWSPKYSLEEGLRKTIHYYKDAYLALEKIY
ncbi:MULTISPECIES: NAD-dependent epimerase/dehydratase family protein [Priestia]